MTIAELDPATASEADFASLHDALCAVLAHDLPANPHPHLADTVARLQHAFTTARRLHWVARVDGRTVGSCELKLEVAPNDTIGEVSLAVVPALRRSGIGRALLGTAVQRIVDEGRVTVTSEVLVGTAGEGFAEAHGFAVALADQGGILRLGDCDAEELDSIVSALPPGYRLQRWTGRIPAEWVDAYARAKAAMADAPTGDLTWQPLPLSATTWRDIEEVFARRDQQLHIITAIHSASGEVAGLTEVSFSRHSPARAIQEDTSVVPKHRGNGLGLIVKADMLRWLRAECPQVHEIETWNAAVNTHMLAINDRLGSRREHIWYEYQAAAATVVEKLRG